MLQDVPRTEAEWGPVPPGWFKVCLDHTKAALDLTLKGSPLQSALSSPEAKTLEKVDN
jgi:hypothetical protein